MRAEKEKKMYNRQEKAKQTPAPFFKQEFNVLPHALAFAKRIEEMWKDCGGKSGTGFNPNTTNIEAELPRRNRAHPPFRER